MLQCPRTVVSEESLAARLPALLPRVIEWETRESQRILQSGQPLTPLGIAVARAVGVTNPERIRGPLICRSPFWRLASATQRDLRAHPQGGVNGEIEAPTYVPWL